MINRKTRFKIIAVIAIVVTILLINMQQPIHSEMVTIYSDIYTYYCDTRDKVPYGNYHIIQPGLYSIANQMSEEDGRMRRKGDHYVPITAYPIILNTRLLYKNLSNIDTLRFNWHNDTILCKNLTKDYNGDFTYNCEIVSSVDSMKVYNIGKDPFFTHGFYMDDRYKDTYMRAIRHWDKKMLDNIFLPDSGHITSEFLVISRLIIEDGKLMDVKFMKSRGVREPYSILPQPK